MKKLTFILLIGFGTLSAQVLKLEDAVSLALGNNHGIIIAQKEEVANKTDIHPGAVGLLPKVDATANGSQNVSISDLEFAQDAFPAIENQEAGQESQQAQISASYLIFNGGARLRSYQKLKKSGDLAEMQTKITIESTLIQVVNSYYEVVRLSNQLDLIKASIDLSKERLERVNTNYDYGNASRIEVLNAQVDLNNDSANFVNTELSIRQAKNNLNYLLGRTIATDFEVDTQLDLPELGESAKYISSAKENNTSVLLSNVQLNMAELDKKIARSNFMPMLSTSFNYGYNASANDVGVVQKSSSLGYTAAVSLSWNLFDGMKKQKALEKAKINIDVNNSKQQQTLLNIEKEVQNYYDALQSSLLLITLEESNLSVATTNLERSKALFEVGTISNFQFRQAQLNLLQIQNRINNQKYMAKVYEYQLLRMTNELVK